MKKTLPLVLIVHPNCYPDKICTQIPLYRRMDAGIHKVLTYIKYRTVSGVFRELLTPHPLFTLRVCPPPRTKGGGGGYALAGRWGGGGGVNSSEDARQWPGLLQYNPSTLGSNLQDCCDFGNGSQTHKAILHVLFWHTAGKYFEMLKLISGCGAP